MNRAPTFFTVPAGTPSAACTSRACMAIVYWIVTEKGKRMPVDCKVDGGRAPTAHEDGQGLSHFATCCDADRFRRRQS